MPIPRIDFKASDPVRAALAAIGRTEDIRFSPDNKLLAIAGFARNRCLILHVDVKLAATGPEVTVQDFLELTSDSMGGVHGLDFIDDGTLVIANRDGVVSILPLPAGDLAGRHCKVESLRDIRGGLICRLNTPGSIAATREPNGQISLLVCNNYTHRVTRHLVDAKSPYRVTKNRVLMKRRLSIPDGIALSSDGRWIAVSSHGTRDVKIFDASRPLGRRTLPAGILLNANYPHGVRFTGDDEHIVVADAGSPVIKIYDRGTGWEGSREPARTVTVLDDETFERGRKSFEEGGPKGLDIDRSNSVVAVTCEEQTLAFFSLAAILGDDRQQRTEMRRTA